MHSYCSNNAVTLKKQQKVLKFDLQRILKIQNLPAFRLPASQLASQPAS